MGLKIVELGAYLPSRRIDNEFFASYLDTSDQWIQQRTGICYRHFSQEGLSKMVDRVLEKMPLVESQKDKIKIVLTASVSPDYIMPSISAIVHGKLELREDVFASDINMACTGFVGSLILANSFLQEGQLGLCIGGEHLSSITNFHDRSTAFLFGDGAAIALVEKTKEDLFSVYGTKISFDLRLNKMNGAKVEMEGKNIYKFATSLCPKAIKDILNKSGLTMDQIRWIVLHQANSRIIESVAKKIGYKDKFYQNIDRVGNTSSASIGLCLNQMRERDLLSRGDKVLLLAFGGGLTYGGCIIEWGEE